MTRRTKDAIVTLTSLAVASSLLNAEQAASRPAPSGRPSSSPATQSVIQFQPGVTINWPQRQVEVDAVVVLRRGLLEVLACTAQTKEHESILRVNAKAGDIYAALGLIGAVPGKPMLWDRQTEKFAPASGEAVDVLVQWKDGGKRQTRYAWELMRRTDNGPPLLDLVWIFAGSYRERNGAFAADDEGVVVAVVNFASALLAVPENRTDDNAELWVEANTDSIPPLGTGVRLVVRPAALRVALDATGRAIVDARPVTRFQLRDILRGKLAHDRCARVLLTVEPNLPDATVELALSRMVEAGIARERITLRRTPAGRHLPHAPTSAPRATEKTTP